MELNKEVNIQWIKYQNKTKQNKTRTRTKKIHKKDSAGQYRIIPHTIDRCCGNEIKGETR